MLDTQSTLMQDTPYLLMSLAQVSRAFDDLVQYFPRAGIYYAVKANPAPEIVRLLLQKGSYFDVASTSEIDLCLAEHANPKQLSYGNTIKKAKDIVYAFERGVKLFSFDSSEELDKLAEFAPGSKVFCRVLVSSQGASWPLSRKFGCSLELAEQLLYCAKQKGLIPYGVSFHVGSQQTQPHSWKQPLEDIASLFHNLAKQHIHLQMVNLGGGFPAHYNQDIPALETYAEHIHEALKVLDDFTPEVVLEPGRSLVADAGKIISEVVLISRKSPTETLRWVYLDVGKFNGLTETLDEAIRYRIRTPYDGQESAPVILAGPTCDSADILYEKHPYHLPLSLSIGDKLEILSTGAYTSSYASVGFNGFKPLSTYFVEE
jgi:ornithine decarboxylase